MVHINSYHTEEARQKDTAGRGEPTIKLTIELVKTSTV